MKSDDLEQFWEQVLSKELGEGKGETGNKYARILESAIKIFSKKGFAGSRTSEIAKSADVAEGTIFRYFPKKDDILMEMILPLVVQFYRPIMLEKNKELVEKSKGVPTEELLKNIFTTRINLIEENMDLLKILFIEALYNEDLRKIFTEKMLYEIFNSGVGVTEAQKQSGNLKDIESKEMFKASLSMLVGYVLLSKFAPNYFESDRDKDVETMVEILLHGVMKERKGE